MYLRVLENFGRHNPHTGLRSFAELVAQVRSVTVRIVRAVADNRQGNFVVCNIVRIIFSVRQKSQAVRDFVERDGRNIVCLQSLRERQGVIIHVHPAVFAVVFVNAEVLPDTNSPERCRISVAGMKSLFRFVRVLEVFDDSAALKNFAEQEGILRIFIVDYRKRHGVGILFFVGSDEVLRGLIYDGFRRENFRPP